METASLPAMPAPVRSRVGRLVIGRESDERLVARARSGDEAASEEICRRYQPPLQRYCHSILGNAEDAADAVQTTLFAAVTSFVDGRPPVDLRPWLYRIAHNESISILRKRRDHVELEDAPPEALAHLDVGGETRERLAELIRDLKSLTERQRGALVMRELSGLAIDEIAAALAISESAAKQAIFEARRALGDYAAGRSLACEKVQRAVSHADGRRLRSRQLRSHIRECRMCASYRAAIDTRERDLGLLAPALLVAGGSGSWLAQLLAGLTREGSAATAAGAGAGGAQAISAGVLVKGAALIAATAGTLGLSNAGALPIPLPGERESATQQAAGVSHEREASRSAKPQPREQGARSRRAGRPDGADAGRPTARTARTDNSPSGATASAPARSPAPTPAPGSPARSGARDAGGPPAFTPGATVASGGGREIGADAAQAGQAKAPPAPDLSALPDRGAVPADVGRDRADAPEAPRSPRAEAPPQPSRP